MKTKRCPRCKEDKPRTCFYSRKRSKDGLNCYCKECSKAIRTKFYRENKVKCNKWSADYRKQNKKKIDDGERKRKFGLELGEFDKTKDAQKGLCAICGLPESAKRKNKVKELAVDHNHTTKEIRGLLCHKCNIALGLLKVDIFGILPLQKAIKYLENGNG